MPDCKYWRDDTTGEEWCYYEKPYELYPCEDPEANCQCTKEKVDSAEGTCGGPPGCFKAEN